MGEVTGSSPVQTTIFTIHKCRKVNASTHKAIYFPQVFRIFSKHCSSRQSIPFIGDLHQTLSLEIKTCNNNRSHFACNKVTKICSIVLKMFHSAYKKTSFYCEHFTYFFCNDQKYYENFLQPQTNTFLGSISITNSQNKKIFFEKI
jgi:hypothetical protein